VIAVPEMANRRIRRRLSAGAAQGFVGSWGVCIVNLAAVERLRRRREPLIGIQPALISGVRLAADQSYFWPSYSTLLKAGSNPILVSRFPLCNGCPQRSRFEASGKQVDPTESTLCLGSEIWG
jgi:hypothetical protein